MILLIDAGNTRIKWAVLANDAAPGAWLDSGALNHSEVAGLRAVCARHPRLERAFACNVAGAALGAAMTAALAPCALQWLHASAHCAGVSNAYDNPAQLGADRWAALIGARHLHPGPCLVVSAGTATTADVLDADGRFRGGVILPGVDLMLRALAGNTAQLPLADGRYCDFPRNTADAIVSGCLLAQAGAVNALYARVATQPQACCILTGGAAARFADLLQMPLCKEDTLVLQGLAIAARALPPGAPMG
ncbi:type III pantothenate kinase [Pseudothauera lacus]|uniref:Type III pantothenate kinase n=1 Tax=Pseudothauera lacus TaxID=2136175 RepID=A0A2T4ICJ7_9RHOO|nr:type III pantothenate kinase [Pseudothauera lacus]PTD95493.1 type III pantothenate kinase [Pseudothauera lacus]